LFRCKEVYVYAMGQEPWLNYITSIKYTSDSLPIVESDKLLSGDMNRESQLKDYLGKERS